MRKALVDPALRFVAFAVAFAFGCAAPQTMASTPTLALPDSGPHLLAGAYSADITPPPGLGLFGHGPESRVSVGQRTRLRCQVVMLQGRATLKATDAVALVTCDLGQPSLLLQRRIAASARELGVPLGADRIVLLATHTHAGPGHYFDSGNLSGVFSSRLTGHDPEVVKFLADRIAVGLRKAYEDLSPARIGWGYMDVYGLSRNRSLSALRHNRGLPEPLASAMADGALRARYGDAGVAVDPRMAVLRIDHLTPSGSRPRAAFLVFGVHPTVIPNDQVLYGGDLFGYATREFESLVRAHAAGASDDFVAALANGIEGDVSPNAQARGAREAQRLGHAVAARAFSIFVGLGGQAEWLRADQTLDVAYRELSFPNARVSSGVSLCARPELGTSAAGGASDNPTSLRVLAALNPGVHAVVPRACQGEKFPLLQPTGPADPGAEFPGIAPISLIRIGQGLLAAVPAEVTTVTGLRIREGILAEADGADLMPADVMILGLANQYMQYVATAEEYRLQRYEGASTLYGPGTARFLRDQHVCLAAHLFHRRPATPCHCQTASIDGQAEIPYDPGPSTSRLADLPKVLALVREMGPPRAVETADARLGCELRFVGPSAESLRAPDGLRIAIERIDDSMDGSGDAQAVTVDDDTGQSLELRQLEGLGNAGALWSVLWTPAFANHAEHPMAPAACGKRYRFGVHSGSAVNHSAVFRFDCERPACEVVP